MYAPFAHILCNSHPLRVSVICPNGGVLLLGFVTNGLTLSWFQGRQCCPGCSDQVGPKKTRSRSSTSAGLEESKEHVGKYLWGSMVYAQHLGAERHPWPTANMEWGLQSYNHKEVCAANLWAWKILGRDCWHLAFSLMKSWTEDPANSYLHSWPVTVSHLNNT